MRIKLIMAFLLYAGSAWARAPFLVNYQGRLLESGVPANGNRPVIFRMYAALNGGTALWQSDVQTVHVTNGIFQTMIGQTTALASPTAFTNIDWSSNNRFVEVQVGLDVLSPRERLTSVPYALFADNGVPPGAVIMWSGSVASIPAGWALCDGQVHNGKLTPDLRDRFIIGAGSIYNPGDTGGSAIHSHTVNGHTHTMSHTHDISHTHGMDHTHTYSGNTGTGLGEVDGGADGNKCEGFAFACWDHYHSFSGTTSGASSANTGGASPGTSGGSSSGSTGSASPGTDAANHLPSYFALAYIMKL